MILLVGCDTAATAPSDGGGTGGNPPPPVGVAQIVVVAGDDQTDSIGGVLDSLIVVRAIDDSGHPVVNQVISWVPDAEDGSVFAPSTATDSNGLAQQQWTVGVSAGVQHLQARTVNADGPVIYATVGATVTPGAPLAPEITTVGTWDTVAVGDTIDGMASFVSARDRAGNLITDITLTASFWDPGAPGDPQPDRGRFFVADTAGRRDLYLWVNGVRQGSVGRVFQVLTPPAVAHP